MKERTGSNNKRTYLRPLSDNEFQVDYPHPVTGKRIRRNIEVSDSKICNCIDRLIDYVTEIKPDVDDLYTFLKTNEFYSAFADELFPIMQLIYSNYLTKEIKTTATDFCSKIFDKHNTEKKYEKINTFSVAGTKDNIAFVLSHITGLSQKVFDLESSFYSDYLICPDFTEAELHLVTKSLETDVIRFFSSCDPVKEKLDNNLYLTKYIIADSSRNNIEYLLESLYANKELSEQIIGLRLVYPISSELRTCAKVREPFVINSIEINSNVNSCYSIPQAASISLASCKALILAGDKNGNLKAHFSTRFNNTMIFSIDKEDEINDTFSNLVEALETQKKALGKLPADKKNVPDAPLFIYDYKKLSLLYKEAYDEFFHAQEMLLDKANTSPEDLESALLYLTYGNKDTICDKFSPSDNFYCVLSSKISNFIDIPKSININIKNKEQEKLVKRLLLEQKKQTVMEQIREEVFDIFHSDKADSYYLSLLQLKEQKNSDYPLYEAANEIREGILSAERKLIPDIDSYLNSTVIEHFIDKIEKIIAG